MTVSRRPTLLHGCAAAATTAEASFRIDVSVDVRREARVIALDSVAADVTAELTQIPWNGAQMFVCDKLRHDISSNGHHPDPVLRTLDGAEVRLSEALNGADVAVMVATVDDGADLAEAIGEACSDRHIMTAGIVVDTDHTLGAAVMALRPHAQVLLVSSDADDVLEVLTALRA